MLNMKGRNPEHGEGGVDFERKGVGADDETGGGG